MLNFLSCLSQETLLKVLRELYLDLNYQVIYDFRTAIETSKMIALVEGVMQNV